MIELNPDSKIWFETGAKAREKMIVKLIRDLDKKGLFPKTGEELIQLLKDK